MRRLSPLLLAVPLTMAAPHAFGPHADGPIQEPVPEQEPEKPEEAEDSRGERDIFGRPVRQGGRPRSATDRLEGCWQLIDIDLNGYPERGRRHSGYALIEGGFIALELHMTWENEELAVADYHQSFIAEYRLTPEGRLRVNTVIGAFIDDASGELLWERSGFVREYDFSVDNRSLTLRFGKGNRMTFAPRKSSNPGERDIFGREAAAPTQERDIFGRPLKRDEKDDKAGERNPRGGRQE